MTSENFAEAGNLLDYLDAHKNPKSKITVDKIFKRDTTEVNKMRAMFDRDIYERAQEKIRIRMLEDQLKTLQMNIKAANAVPQHDKRDEIATRMKRRLEEKKKRSEVLK
jgi:hypothetical protein